MPPIRPFFYAPLLLWSRVPFSWCGIVCFALFFLAACTSTVPLPGEPQVRTSPSPHFFPSPEFPHALVTVTPLGPNSCHPPSPVSMTPTGLPRYEGTTPYGGAFWIVVLSPLRAQQPVKMVWGVSGTSTLSYHSEGPGGTQAQFSSLGTPDPQAPTWGAGKTYNFTLIFPVAGCWDLSASQVNLIGDVWLIVT